MLGLAAQKFVSDIAKDAYAFARTRTTAGPGRNPGGTGSAQGPSGKNKVSTEPAIWSSADVTGFARLAGSLEDGLDYGGFICCSARIRRGDF